MKAQKITSFLVLSLFSGWATQAHAYRTAGDLEEFAGTERVAWADAEAEFVLHVDTPSGLGGTDTSEQSLLEALGVWNGVQCSGFSAEYAGRTNGPALSGDGVNTVSWLFDGWEERGFSRDAAGATDVLYSDVGGEWKIIEADVFLNGEHFSWSYFPEDADRQARGVLVHELGHALGLMHPCGEGEVPTCGEQSMWPTMAPNYSEGQDSLHEDDIDGACFLYPSTCGPEGCGATLDCEGDSCPERCGEFFCGFGAECVDGVCERQAMGPSCEADECDQVVTELGDACSATETCQLGDCFDGFCAPECEGADCERSSGFGETCGAGEDCITGLCLADLGSRDQCTRHCGEGHAECPENWACDEIDDEEICVPQSEEQSGCATQPRPTPSSPQFFLVLLLAGALARIRSARD